MEGRFGLGNTEYYMWSLFWGCGDMDMAAKIRTCFWEGGGGA